MANPADPVARGIETIINQKGLRKKYVADCCGFTAQQFSDMLNGRKVIRADYLPTIAKALNVGITDLFSAAHDTA